MAKVVRYPTPKDEAEAARLLGELERLKLELDKKQVALNQAVNDLVTRANDEAEAVANEFAEKFTALKKYAHKHKVELTQGGKQRSVSWATGTLGWRNIAAGISVPRSSKDVALLVGRLLAARKSKFLRRKWELNVEAMEARPEEAAAIEGIKRRAARELFFIKFSDGAEIRQKITLKAPTTNDLKEVG